MVAQALIFIAIVQVDATVLLSLLAGLIVKSLPLDALRWLVVIVVVYAAIMTLRSAAARVGVSPVPGEAPSA